MRLLIVVCLGFALLSAGANRVAGQGPAFDPAAVKPPKDADRKNRLEAVRTVGDIGSGEVVAFPVHLKRLNDEDKDVRIGAAKALGHILVHEVEYDTKAGPRRRIEPDARAVAVAGLTKALQDTDREMRFYAACALVQIEPQSKAAHGVLKEDLPRLGKLLAAEDVDNRVFAAKVLGCLGADAEAAVPRLFHTDYLTKADYYAMRDALVAIGPAAVPFVSKALKEGDHRGKAVEILARIGPKAKDLTIPALSEALKDKDPHVRVRAASALKELDPNHEPAVQTLADAVKDASKEVRRRALFALGRPAAVWVEVLQDTDKDFSLATADALDHYRECGRELPRNGSEEYYRFAAAHTLVNVGPDAKAVVPDLAEALKDANRDVRFYAACALLQIEPQNKKAAAVLVKELPALSEMLKDGDGRRVAFAADVLGCLGSKAEPAVPALREAVACPRQSAVPGATAMRALKMIRPAEEETLAFSLTYAHAGLTEVSLTKGKMHYVWHTPRHADPDKSLPIPQSLDSYDRHEVDIRLTPKEWERFWDWSTRHKPSDFEKSYPSAFAVESYGTAFASTLVVIRGEKKHATAWVGDSKIPDGLATAVNELVSLAEEIEKSRSR